MAGNEHSGVRGSRADLFHGAVWVLTPSSTTSDEAYAAVRSIVSTLGADDQVRVVVFTGAGEKAFCAGADLKERVGFTEEQTRAFVARPLVAV